jgi:hypothetical protein
MVHASPKLILQLGQLQSAAFRHRDSLDLELPLPGLPTHVGEAKEVESLGLTLVPVLSVLRRKATELDQTGLLRVELERELRESFAKLVQAPIGFRLVLEADDEVIRIADDDDIATSALAPVVDPQIEDIVQIDVCQQWRDTPALGRPLLCTVHFPFFQHASLEPLFDVADDTLVPDSVFDETDQPFVGDGIEGKGDTLPISRTSRRQ